ncbi:unnamed protein product [Didymodactylos carnosus]|uniref:Shisa N-terminal domain-containing protein n=1 Tax=Didymodactylos carnosus TaxID=1234261 RepID=A0A813WP00_9BILA|nr:unnamed protein product [Didymodactylos carnosus]CAF1430789.1 unnamed protein product [Didymodactylos carnosus]CAF3647752.1 unnamed protein product [Didymodactylos carnosus]CAF4228815.1 unnamed protein product [Didymodactylos carnosus]
MRASCPGFLDRHGIWNNGFDCPPPSAGPIRMCCGTESERYCCISDDNDQTNSNNNIYFSNKHQLFRTLLSSSSSKPKLSTYLSATTMNDRFSNYTPFLTGVFSLFICFLICLLCIYLYFQFTQNCCYPKRKKQKGTKTGMVRQSQQHDGLLTLTTLQPLPYRNMAYLTSSSTYRSSQQQNRISTISSETGKSSTRTDTSVCDLTPLNLYPTMTTSLLISENDETNQPQVHQGSPISSSCYVFPNELEYLCHK